MAYKLFEELSTCNLEEIAEEDLQKIMEDIHAEIKRRQYEQKKEAISKFKEAFNNLYNTGVTLSFWVNTEEWEGNVYVDDIDEFTFG